MAQKSINHAKLYVHTRGSGEDVIVFSHGYLMNHSMFNGQIEALSKQFTCVSYDQRGHGQSEVTADGYDMDNLVDDAIALIESLNVGAVHFVGMSTGGFVGMRIGLRRPDLLKSLVLMDTAAEGEPARALIKYKALTWIVKHIGWWAVTNKVMSILFYKDFLNDKNRQHEVKHWKKIVTGHSNKGVMPFADGIFARDNVLPALGQLKLPVAVVVGEFDASTKPLCSQRMVNAINGAKLYTIKNAGHSAAVEKPEDVAQALVNFYKAAGFMA